MVDIVDSSDNYINRDISIRWQGDVSTITSPCFGQRSPTNGGSLFSRLSRGEEVNSQQVASRLKSENDVIIGSPIESDTEPSPIKASDSLIECEPDTEFKLGDSQSFTTNSIASDKSKNRRARILSLLDAIDSIDGGDKTKSDSVVVVAAAAAVAANTATSIVSFDNCEKNLSFRTHEHDMAGNRTNVSFEKEPAAASVKNISFDNSAAGHLNDSMQTKRDEWKAVVDPESGKTYYYNR